MPSGQDKEDVSCVLAWVKTTKREVSEARETVERQEVELARTKSALEVARVWIKGVDKVLREKDDTIGWLLRKLNHKSGSSFMSDADRENLQALAKEHHAIGGYDGFVNSDTVCERVPDDSDHDSVDRGGVERTG
jgi:hypothetical protein